MPWASLGRWKVESSGLQWTSRAALQTSMPTKTSSSSVVVVVVLDIGVSLGGEGCPAYFNNTGVASSAPALSSRSGVREVLSSGCRAGVLCPRGADCAPPGVDASRAEELLLSRMCLYLRSTASSRRRRLRLLSWM